MPYADFENEVLKHFSREAKLEDLDRHDLLAAWFVFAQLTDEDVTATRAALTRPPDAGVDAVLIDHPQRTVHLVQSKLREKEVSENKKDIEYLTKWHSLLIDDESTFNDALTKKGKPASPTTQKLLRAARAVANDGYDVAFHFVTTGKAPRNFEATEQRLKVGESRATFSFRDRRSLLLLYEDYLAAVRPIPEVTLPVASHSFTDEEVNGIEMSVYLAPGDEIKKLVDRYGPRLFARNVRSYQGENEVNEKISETIHDTAKAARFRYMNNGLTVACDRAVVVSEGGDRHLRLWNPQVVNGQQTSYTLQKAGAAAANVRVLVKVVRIQRNRDGDDPAVFKGIIDDIVLATNWQTKVTRGDLHSNDDIQVNLGRALRGLGHYYQRKSAPWGETLAAARGLPAVTRGQLADAVGGCLFESKPLRESKDRLYEEPSYSKIFKPKNAKRHLCCYYLWKEIRKELDSKTAKREQNRAKWLVLYHLYIELGDDLVRNADVFIANGVAKGGIKGIRLPLERCVKATADACAAFFHETATENQDAHNFFREQNLHPDLVAFVRTQSSKALRDRLHRALDSLRQGLTSVELGA